MLPLADLLYSDPYAVLMAGVTYGRYLGIHQAAGVACHHLAFSQATIEWQIWIDAGDKPLPRKLVISYVQEPGEPQYSAVIRRWTLERQGARGALHVRGPGGRAEDRRAGDEAARGRRRRRRRRRLRREDADAGQESSVLAAPRVRGGRVDPAARAARGARLRAASRGRRGPVARIGQQRQPQRPGHGRKLVGPAHERHHQPDGDGQRLEPHDHGHDPERAVGDGHAGRHQVGRRGDGGPQRPDEQRRQQELAEDLRDGRRAGRVGGAGRPGDEPVRPDGRVGRQGRALRLRLGVRGRGQEPLRAERRGRGLRRARTLRRRCRRRRRGRPLRRPHGRRGPGLRGAGPRREPSLRRPALQLPRPLVLRLRRRLLSTRTTYHGAPYYTTCRRPGAATTRRSRSAPSR